MESHLRKSFAILLSILTIITALPIYSSAAALTDWQIEGDYAILSGQELYDSSTSVATKELIMDFGRTYVKFTPTEGSAPTIDVWQSKSDINFAEYDYYVFKYKTYDTTVALDTCFRSDAARTGIDYESAYPYSWYQQWSTIGHPAKSNNAWVTKIMTRDEFQGCAVGFAPVSTLQNQYFEFKPWNNSAASDKSYAAFEYIAFFTTEAEANAFIEMQNAGSIPARSLKLLKGGDEVDEIEIFIGQDLPIDFSVLPAYTAGAIGFYDSNNLLTLNDGVFKASALGTTTLEVTALASIDGLRTITKTIDVTVKATGAKVVSASDITYSTNGLTATTQVVNNDDLEKKLLRTEVTAATTADDNTYITLNVGSENINAHAYPYFTIGYRAKTTGATYTDLNVNFDKYHPAGTGDAVSTRLWGPTPSTAQETFGKMNIKYTQYTSGSRSYDTSTDPWTNLGYDWNWIDNTAKYESIVLKPWKAASTTTVGDYFEIEYIAFFTDEDSMDSFVYSVELEGIETDAALTVAVGGSKKIDVTTSPEKAYAKLTYTCLDSNIATVSSSGTVTGVSAGSTTVTVSAADGALTATCLVTVTEGEQPDYMIVGAQDLDGNTAAHSSLTATTTVKNYDDLKKRTVRTDITQNGGSGDNALIKYSFAESNIPSKDYPYIQISYRAKVTNATWADFNIGVTNYKQSGGSTPVGVRLWGPTPAMTKETFSKMNIDNTQYTGGENVGSYNWNYVTDASRYTYINIKPWYAGAAVAGDYFEVEYIAFFKTTDARDAFVYDTELTGLSVDETMDLTVGSFDKLGVKLTPAGAYTTLTYTSSAPTVASVDSNGNVVARSIGSATITVTAADGDYTDTCTVTVSERDKDYSSYITDRGNLNNLLYKLENDKKLNIVYLGGSVTAGAGASNAERTSWRALTGAWFKNMFPDAEINLYNVAMGGSGSMLGAFRCESDVLSKDPDLVFVEFAVNDSYSGHNADGTVQLYYESILRQIRKASPDTEIISIFTSDQGHLNDTTMHAVAALQDAVAAHYSVSSVNVGLALTNHIVAENAAWSDYVSDSVHPADAGYAIYASAIEQYLFDELFVTSKTPSSLAKHTVPLTYIDSRNATFSPKYVTVSQDIFDSITGWTYSSSKVYSNLATDGYIYPNGTGNSFSYTFKGTGIAFFMEFDGGKYLVQYSIDGGDPTTLRVTDTNHAFNKMYKTGTLDDKEHTITFSYLGADADGDNVVDTGDTGVRSNLKITRLLVSQTTADKDYLAGDVNDDGKVTAADSIMLNRYLGYWSGYTSETINLTNANVDGVTGVTASDGIALTRHIANWSEYASLPLTPNDGD